MKLFNIRFDGTRALVSVSINAGDNWYKKTVSCNDESELWQGLNSLLKIDSLPEEQKAAAGEYISKAKEQELIEVAIPAWLAKGNEIKRLPKVGEKLELTSDEREEILLELGLELETEEETESEALRA